MSVTADTADTADTAKACWYVNRVRKDLAYCIPFEGSPFITRYNWSEDELSDYVDPDKTTYYGCGRKGYAYCVPPEGSPYITPYLIEDDDEYDDPFESSDEEDSDEEDTWMDVYYDNVFTPFCGEHAHLQPYKYFYYYKCWGGGPEGGYITNYKNNTFRVNRTWGEPFTVERVEGVIESCGDRIRIIKREEEEKGDYSKYYCDVEEHEDVRLCHDGDGGYYCEVCDEECGYEEKPVEKPIEEKVQQQKEMIQRMMKRHAELKAEEKYSEEKIRDSIKTFGHWVWRRVDGEEVKLNAILINRSSGGTLRAKNVEEDWGTYWDEWTSIIGKKLITPRITVEITTKGEVIVSKLLDSDGLIPKTKKEIIRAFVVECRNWMNDPSPPKVMH